MAFKELWEKKQPTVSFEFYPAHSEKAEAKLNDTIAALMEARPDFVSVTFGAGGSSRDGSYQLIRRLVGMSGPAVVGYVAAYGLGAKDLEAILDGYLQVGVDAILCVRGDRPDDVGFTPHPQALSYAKELISLARKRSPVSLGVAGYPEGHIEAENKEKDWEYLKQKVDEGAEYIISQYFYDNRFFFEFVDKCRSLGIRIPILAGVMPIYSIKLTRSLAEKCGASIPLELQDKLSHLDAENKEGVETLGVELAVSQCRELIRQNVAGLHFYTMDRSPSVLRIIDQLKREGLLA